MPHLVVKNRDKTIFEGEVSNISSYNKKGLFDVLLDHSNFISVIEKQLIIRVGGSLRNIDFDNGLLEVKGNNISVFIGVK